jgi:dihydrofolate reductase
MPDTTPVRKFVVLSSYHERRMNLGTVIFDMSISLDGFIAGPKNDDKPDRELEVLDRLHDWMFPPKGNFQEIEGERFKNVGAVLMGRRMFNLGEEPWGDDPPFHMPVFVLTHNGRDPLVKKGGTTYFFVTNGIESALAQARQAAGHKNVIVMGGANAIQQFLKAGLLDEMLLHLVPVLLGEGIQLFENIGAEHIELEKISVIEAPSITHLRFRVVR